MKNTGCSWSQKTDRSNNMMPDNCRLWISRNKFFSCLQVVEVNRKMSSRKAYLMLVSKCIFAFTEDFQPGGINHQVRNFTPGLCFKVDVNRLSSFTDTGVIRAAQRNAHQIKNGINKVLSCPQCQSEYTLNHQNGGDSEVRIALRPSPWWRRCWFIPGLNCLVIQPKSEGATVDEGFVVGGPLLPSWAPHK